MSLEGKRILVTGATGILGREVVRRLLAEGAWVAAVYRGNEHLAEMLSLLDPNGPQPKALYAELSDADSVERLAQELAHDLPLHGLALLAGGWTGGARVWEAPETQMHEMIKTNVLPTWRTLRRFVPGMVEAGYGRIVTVGARHGVRPTKGNAAYGASKAAVMSLTQGLSEDLRGTGVTATCVVPSSIRPGGENGAVSPERVAAAISWLLDDDASVATGTLLPVYGDR